MTWRAFFEDQQRRRELATGRSIASFHESVFARVSFDGSVKTFKAILTVCISASRQWMLLILGLLFLASLIRSDFRLFLRGVPLTILLGLVIGTWIGGMIAIAGRTLEVTEDVGISLNIPATATYRWSFDEISYARVVRGSVDTVAVEIELDNSKYPVSRFRLVGRASIEQIDKLKRMLQLPDSHPDRNITKKSS